MKIKSDFVTNSSSTSFIITNRSNEKKTLVDFVKENEYLLREFQEQYTWHMNDTRMTQENMISGAEAEDIEFDPGESRECIFGDEQGTVIGQVYDYILRDGGSSESFTWHFDQYYR